LELEEEASIPPMHCQMPVAIAVSFAHSSRQQANATRCDASPSLYSTLHEPIVLGSSCIALVEAQEWMGCGAMVALR